MKLYHKTTGTKNDLLSDISGNFQSVGNFFCKMSLSHPYKSHSVASVSNEQIEWCYASASGCWRKLQIKVITNFTSLKLIKNWNDEDCFIWQALRRDWVKNKIQSYISEDSGIVGFNVRKNPRNHSLLNLFHIVQMRKP